MANLTTEERNFRNKELEVRAKKRLESRGAPFFGVAERDVLQMRVQIVQVLQQQKQMGEDLNGFAKEKEELKSRVKELHYMVRSLVDLLVGKEVFSALEFNDRVKKRQLKDLAMVEVDRGVVGVGDLVTIKFKFLSGETVVDDRTQQPMLYEMGTKGMPCEDRFVGLKKGDKAVFQDVIFGDNFRLKEYANKPLTMELTICGVHVRQVEKVEHVEQVEKVEEQVEEEVEQVEEQVE